MIMDVPKNNLVLLVMYIGYITRWQSLCDLRTEGCTRLCKSNRDDTHRVVLPIGTMGCHLHLCVSLNNVLI